MRVAALLLPLAAAGFTLPPVPRACAEQQKSSATTPPPAPRACAERQTSFASTLSPAESSALYASLKARRADVDDGAGKRFRVDSLVGFLNVHSEPDDPFRLDNVVGQLGHGEVVESTSERGDWVAHDGGGWSIRVHDGHHFLVPLD